MTIRDFKDIAGIAKDVGTAIGFLGAAASFLYKWASGYLVVSLNVTLRCERAPKLNAEVDLLSITALIVTGDRGSVLLQDAQVEVVAFNSCQRLPLVAVERLSIERVREEWLSRHKVLWGNRSRRASFLNLTPGEETAFSCYCEVPMDAPCTVSVAILGHRPSKPHWSMAIVNCLFAMPGHNPGVPERVINWPIMMPARTVRAVFLHPASP